MLRFEESMRAQHLPVGNSQSHLLSAYDYFCVSYPRASLAVTC